MHREWNKFYKNNGRFYLLPHPDIQRAIEKFKENDAFKVLDVGCGSGRNLVPLAQGNLMVTGIDFAPAAGHLAEEWLREKGLEGKVYIGDYKKDLVSFKKDEFDAVVSINSLQYVEEVKDLEDSLGEINRVLKENGKLFLVLPSPRTIIFQPQVTQSFFDKQIIESLLSAYFEIDEIYTDEDKAWVVFATNKRNVIEK